MNSAYRITRILSPGDVELGVFVAAGEGFGDVYEDIAESVDLHRSFNPAGNTVLYKLAGLFETGDVQYHIIGALFAPLPSSRAGKRW